MPNGRSLRLKFFVAKKVLRMAERFSASAAHTPYSLSRGPRVVDDKVNLERTQLIKLNLAHSTEAWTANFISPIFRSNNFSLIMSET